MAKKVYKEKETVTKTKKVQTFSTETSKTKKIIGAVIASVLALAIVGGVIVLAISEAKKDNPASSSVPLGNDFGATPDANPDDDDNWTTNY